MPKATVNSRSTPRWSVSGLPGGKRCGSISIRVWLIHALDGADHLRRHTLQQLEHYANADWVISHLVRMECLVDPLLY